MAEKRTSSLDFWLGHFENFCQIARELREFEAYEIIDDLRYRMMHFAPNYTITETTEPDMDVHRKCFRITFIGEASAPEKRKFIEAAFPEAIPFQVENSSGDASDIESYYYYEKSTNCRFALINTPSLSESKKMTDIGELHTEAVVFVIGNVISESEKSCLEKIKYQVDPKFLVFLPAAENPSIAHHYIKKNKRDIAEILKEDIEKIRYFSSNESSSIRQQFADEGKCSSLLFQKIRNYMIQYYDRFEINVEAYLRSVTELDNFNKDIGRIEDKAFTEVNWISSQFKKKLDQEFPIEASYSVDVRAEIKKITRQLSERKIKEKDVGKMVADVLDEDTRKLLKEWTEKLEDIIAEYLQRISHEVSNRLHESGHVYRLSIPLNRKIELQLQKDFEFTPYFLTTSSKSEYARYAPSAVFPAYYGGKAVAGVITTSLVKVSVIIPATVIFIVVVGVLIWRAREERTKQARVQGVHDAEKDMKLFNYYVAHAIRIEFEEIIHFSQGALRDVFKEIREAEQKRITINNACPAIKAIKENSLLDKICGNLKAIESTREVNDVERKQ